MTSMEIVTSNFKAPLDWVTLYSPKGKGTSYKQSITIENPEKWVIEIQNRLLQAESDVRGLAEAERRGEMIDESPKAQLETLYEGLANGVQTMYNTLQVEGTLTRANIERHYLDIVNASNKLATDLWTTIATVQHEESSKIAALQIVHDRHAAATNALQEFVAKQREDQAAFNTNVNKWAASKEAQMDAL